MRSMKLIITSLILTAATSGFPQYPDINPRTLPAQVAAQELVVQTEAGSKDWQAWLKLAVLLQDSGIYRESEEAYLHTITLLRAPAPLTVADVFDHMGTMYIQSGQLSKAEPLEHHALAIREHQNDQLGTGVSHMHLAMLFLRRNELRSAETEARAAVTLLVPEYPQLSAASSPTPSATPEQKMNALIDLALVECASGAGQGALPRLRWALQIAHENYPENSSPVGYINFLLGYAYWKTGNTKDAGQWMSDGIHTLAAEIGWGQPTYLSTLRQYHAFLVETGQRAKAQQVASEMERLDTSKVPFAIASGAPATVQNLPK